MAIFYARGDSSSANNASLNVQNTNTTPTTTLDFQPTTGGDLLLEYNGGLPDSDTVVFVDGVEMTFTLEFSGTLAFTQSLANVNGVDLRGAEIIVITTEDGQRYFFLADGSASFATMMAFPNGAHTIENIDTGTDILLCFSASTLIETPDGQVKVEDLRVGDMVTTLSGSAELLWIGVRKISTSELQANPHFRPVVIKKDAFGARLPACDLTLSPNHRVLMSGWPVELNFDTESMLCAAKYLVNEATIKTDTSATTVEYYHLMFENHEVVFSNGMPTESLLAGAVATTHGAAAAQYEFKEIFGIKSRQDTDAKPVAYPTMKRYEAQILRSHFGA